MRVNRLNAILAELNSSSASIEGAGIVSTEGLVITAVLSGATSESQLGAITAALVAAGERTVQELGRGTLEQLLIKGTKGYVLMVHAGSEALLVILAKPEARLGMLFLDAKKAATAIAGLF